MLDWAPILVGLLLFILLSPGLVFVLPGNAHHVDFGTFGTNGKAMVVHTLLFFGIFTIFVMALNTHIYLGWFIWVHLSIWYLSRFEFFFFWVFVGETDYLLSCLCWLLIMHVPMVCLFYLLEEIFECGFFFFNFIYFFLWYSLNFFNNQLKLKFNLIHALCSVQKHTLKLKNNNFNYNIINCLKNEIWESLSPIYFILFYLINILKVFERITIYVGCLYKFILTYFNKFNKKIYK